MSTAAMLCCILYLPSFSLHRIYHQRLGSRVWAGDSYSDNSAVFLASSPERCWWRNRWNVDPEIDSGIVWKTWLWDGDFFRIWKRLWLKLVYFGAFSYFLDFSRKTSVVWGKRSIRCEIQLFYQNHNPVKLIWAAMYMSEIFWVPLGGRWGSSKLSSEILYLPAFFQNRPLIRDN